MLDALGGVMGKRYERAVAGALWTLLFVGAACGSDVVTPPGPPARAEAGARLSPIVLEADGGAEAFNGWYDRALEVRCIFTNTGTGGRRCVPSPFGNVGFRDSDCREPIVLARQFDCQDNSVSYGLLPSPPDVCGNQDDLPSEVYRVTGPGADIDRYHQRTASGCVEVEPEDAYVAYPAAPAAPDAFVGVDREDREGEGRIARRVRVHTDGSRQFLGGYDRQLETPCRVDEDRERCVPSPPATFTVRRGRHRSSFCASRIPRAPSPCSCRWRRAPASRHGAGAGGDERVSTTRGAGLRSTFIRCATKHWRRSSSGATGRASPPRSNRGKSRNRWAHPCRSRRFRRYAA
ncbi:MAG: hypothetical protein AAGN82_02095 [Myxococcota bacterium]